MSGGGAAAARSRPPVAQVRQREARVGAVDLACEAVPVEHRLRDPARGHGVADEVEPRRCRRSRAPPGRPGNSRWRPSGVSVCVTSTRSSTSRSNVVAELRPAAENAARPPLRHRDPGVHDDADIVQVLPQHRTLEGAVGERRDHRMGRDEVHLVSLDREQLGDAGTGVVALAVVDRNPRPQGRCPSMIRSGVRARSTPAIRAAGRAAPRCRTRHCPSRSRRCWPRSRGCPRP